MTAKEQVIKSIEDWYQPVKIRELNLLNGTKTGEMKMNEKVVKFLNMKIDNLPSFGDDLYPKCTDYSKAEDIILNDVLKLKQLRARREVLEKLLKYYKCMEIEEDNTIVSFKEGYKEILKDALVVELSCEEDMDWELVAMSLIDSILDGINDAWDDMDKWRLNSWGIIKDLNVKTDGRLEEAKQRIEKILSTPEGVKKLNQLNGGNS